MTSWYYPSAVLKIAPKFLNCSDCGVVIRKFDKYYRHNHGRYCRKCSELYDAKYGKIEIE